MSDAARSILQRPSRRQAGGNLDDPALGLPERLGRKTAAERTLFYRRVLGAWEFLLAVNERPALARVRELTELERTPFPQPK